MPHSPADPPKGMWKLIRLSDVWAFESQGLDLGAGASRLSALHLLALTFGTACSCQLSMIKSQMLTSDGWNNYYSTTVLRNWWVGLEGQLGVETVLSPAEVWDNKDIYGFQNARWTRRWSFWTSQLGLPDVRPPKIPGQPKDDFILYYTSSHALLAWSIQCEARDKRDILLQGQKGSHSHLSSWNGKRTGTGAQKIWVLLLFTTLSMTLGNGRFKLNTHL